MAAWCWVQTHARPRAHVSKHCLEQWQEGAPWERLQPALSIMPSLPTLPHSDLCPCACMPPLRWPADIANRATDKITQLTDNIYICRSGSAADTQNLSMYVQVGLRCARVLSALTHGCSVHSLDGLYQLAKARASHSAAWSGAGVESGRWLPGHAVLRPGMPTFRPAPPLRQFSSCCCLKLPSSRQACKATHRLPCSNLPCVPPCSGS